MTKLSKIIALLLLAVYLTATGGRTWTSIECEMHHGTMTAHMQHTSCTAPASHELASMGVKSCCDAHHTQDHSLYTPISGFHMPSRPAAAVIVVATEPAVVQAVPRLQLLTIGHYARPAPPPQPPHGGTQGLRAPPELA